MLTAEKNNITMSEGDYGIQLPITIHLPIAAGDSVKITFKKNPNGETLLEKTYSNIAENTVNLEFNESESALFRVGNYVYSLDWYADGNFLCNLIQCASLKVVDKA